MYVFHLIFSWVNFVFPLPIFYCWVLNYPLQTWVFSFPSCFTNGPIKAWFTITQWMGYTNLTILSRPLLLCVVLGKIGPLSEACVNTKTRCPSYMGQVDGWRHCHLITLLGSDLSTHPSSHCHRKPELLCQNYDWPHTPNGAPWIRDFLLSASYSHISIKNRCHCPVLHSPAAKKKRNIAKQKRYFGVKYLGKWGSGGKNSKHGCPQQD